MVKFFNEAGVRASAITVLRQIMINEGSTLKVPRDRIGVIIGVGGSTKAQIEEKSTVKLASIAPRGRSPSRAIRLAF